MSDRLQGWPIVRRAIVEHRVFVVPLVVALLANLVVFLFIVQPLSQRVANVENRNRNAERALAAARQEEQQASGALTSRTDAVERLQTFYDVVLPQGFTEARGLMFPRLWQMGERAGLRVSGSANEIVPAEEGTLTRFRVPMDLTGTYDQARAFIRQIEQDRAFIVIDAVHLQEAGTEGADLQLRVDVSTYYREEAR